MASLVLTASAHPLRVPCLRSPSRQGFLVPWRRCHVRAQASEDEEEMRIPTGTVKQDIQSGETIGEKLERYHQARSERVEEIATETAKLDSGNWIGDEYVGSSWNLLSVILLISIIVPAIGLVFAYFSYGVLWGLGTQAI